MRRLRWVLVLLVPVVALATFLLLHKRPSDRQLIEQLITRLEEGIELKQFPRIMACISDDYQDDAGLKKRDLMRMALRYVRDRGWAQLLIFDVDIDVQDRAAVANMYVEVTYVQGDFEGRPFAGDVTVFFRKKGRRWFIAKSDGWQSAAAAAVE